MHGSFSSEVIYMQNSINAMRFYTNGQERVRIASYGTVGINQPSPSSTYSLLMLAVQLGWLQPLQV